MHTILTMMLCTSIFMKFTFRFHLGGATTLRGFSMWGTGPQDSGYSLGGEAYWATGLHLYHPLPFLRGQINEFLKTHLFLTTGHLFSYGTYMFNFACHILYTKCLQMHCPMMNFGEYCNNTDYHLGLDCCFVLG